jgi:pilus assembly protein CpaB
MEHLMGKNKAIIILGVGVLLALLAGLMTHGWLKGKARAQGQASETQTITVAAVDLTWGTVITKGMVKTAPFLKQTLPDGYFPDAAKLEGRTLIYPLKVNEPILESRLAPANVTGGGIAAVIGPQRRAMAVKVDKVIGVSGFIHPGNRVDVLVTLNRNEKVTAPITKTVLENVLVLATGPETEKAGKGEKSAPVDVITLEVSVDEGEKLALAATEGKLQLALRNLADAKPVATKGTTIPALLSSLNGGRGSTDGVKPATRARQIASSAPAPQVEYSYVITDSTAKKQKSLKGE